MLISKLTRYVSAVLIVWSGYYNLVRIDFLEIRLFEVWGISWLLIPFFTRLFAGFHFLLALLLLFPLKNKGWITTISSVILLVVVCFDFAYAFLHQGFETETMHLSSGPYLPQLLTIAALCFAMLFSGNSKRGITLPHKWAFHGPFILCSLAVPFIINPIFPDDFKMNNKLATDEIPVSEEMLRESSVKGEVVLFCFFTPNCPYCKRACKKIYLSLKPELKDKVSVFFLGNDKQVEFFFRKTSAHFDYQIASPELFNKYELHRWPVFFLFSQGQIIYKWDGKSLNYSVLHHLPDLLSGKVDMSKVYF